MKPWIKYIFSLWLLAYFGLLLFNLDRIPVAWTDETQLLDPAANWVFNGTFSTTLMPYASSTIIYVSSLPFIQWVYIAVLKLFGMNMFFVRLPMVLAAAGSVYFILKLLKENKIITSVTFLICFLFLNDLNTYEMIRAGRVEIFSALFILGSLYFFKIKRFYISTFFISLLLLTHPATWAFCLIIFIAIWINSNSHKSKVALPILVILPTLFWLWTIDFNFLAIREQLIAQGTHHNPEHSQGNFITNLFWHRFYPFWMTQPYILILHVLAIGLAIKSIILKDSPFHRTLGISFIGTEIFMAIMLATHHRYNVILVLLTFLILAQPIQTTVQKRAKLSRLILFALIPLALFPFSSRNLIGLAERKERDPKEVLLWLENNLPDDGKSKLLGGSDIGQYFAVQKEDIDFFEVIYPQNVNFDKYDNIYLFSHIAPKGNWTKLNTYKVEKSGLGKWLSKYHEGQNYNGLTIYRAIETKDAIEHTHEYNIPY